MVSPPFPSREDTPVPADDDIEPDELDDELEEPEDLDEADLEDLDDDDLIDEEVLDDDADLAVLEDDEVEAVEVPVAVVPDEDEDDDDEEEPEPDEIEATPDTAAGGDLVGKVPPKHPGEFVCQSCFLVKHPSQLADADRMWCR